MKLNQLLIAVCVIISIFVVGCDSSYDESFQNAEPDSEINTVEVDNSIGDDIIDEMDEAEKAAEEKAAAEKAAAEKAAAEKAAAEKAASEKAAAEKAAAEKAAAEKAAAEKAAAEKAAAEKAAAEKAAAEEAAKYKIKFIDFPSVFYRNEIVTITIQGKPNTEYNLRIRYKTAWSTASGLGVKISDSEGYVSWTFKVGGRATEGYCPLMRIEGNGEVFETEFLVADGD